MAYGVTDAGFVVKRQDAVIESLETGLQAALGKAINLTPQSPLGSVVATASNALAELWEAAEATYNSEYPATAQGVSLDGVVSITGVQRMPASNSQVTAKVYGTPGTVIPNGTFRAHVDGNTASQFQTVETQTVPAVAVDTAFRINFSQLPTSGTWKVQFTDSVGGVTADAPFDCSAATLQGLMEALVYPGVGGIIVTGTMDDGFLCQYSGANSGLPAQIIPIILNSLVPGVVTASTVMTEYGGYGVEILMDSIDTGQIQAPQQTLTVIDTPITGINYITNFSAAILGRSEETDAELRVRRARELQASDSSTVEGIRNALESKVTGVVTVTVIENATDSTDSGSRPPHSFEAIVNGGTDEDVANQIWLSKPAGIATYGTTTVVITDSMGFDHNISFSRPTTLPIYLIVTLTRNTNPLEGEVYPADGDDQVLAALLAYGLTFVAGQWAITTQLFSPINSVPGIFDIDIKLDIAPAPVSSANIPVSAEQIATFDASRITIL